MYVIRTDECFYCRETRQRWFYINMYLHASRISTSRVIQLWLGSIYVYIICTDIHYIMTAQCCRLMFSLLPSLSPAVKFSEIQKIYFFPSFYYSTVRRRSRFRPRHRRRHDSDEYVRTNPQHKLLLYIIIILLLLNEIMCMLLFYVYPFVTLFATRKHANKLSQRRRRSR